MSWNDRKILETIGFALIILGIILLILVLISAFIQTQYAPCPSPGCPPGGVSYVPLYGPSIFFGLALVIIGIILLIAARKMKPDQETGT